MKGESKNLMNDGVKKQIIQDVDETTGETLQAKAGMSGVRRSIRDIPIPQNGGVKKGVPKASATSSLEEDDYEETPQTPKGRRDMSKYVLWSIVIVSVIALVFAVSSLFTGATVTITPKSQQITLNDTLTASKDGTADIPYQAVQISDTASKSVASDSEEYVEAKASGQIVIYNTHGSASQVLIDQTRFETPDGKIYRIQEEVAVPGQQEIDGKLVPGQLEVTVYADEVGPEYNTGLTEFTIPGFEGDPRFETFYARSKTAMTGGLAGTQPIVNEETKTQAEAELQTILQDKLRAELANRVSDNLIIPEGGSFFSFETLPTTKEEDGSVELVVKGTVEAIAIPSTDFAKAILKKAGGNASVPVKIQDLSTLQTTLLSVEEFDIKNDSEARVGVTGNALLVWTFEAEKIKTDLAGNRKKDLSSILSPYDSIESAQAVIRPFWKRSFPTENDEITVRTTLE